MGFYLNKFSDLYYIIISSFVFTMKRGGYSGGGFGGDLNPQGYQREYGASSGYNVFHKAGHKRKATVVDDDSYFDDDDEQKQPEDDIIAACPFLSEEDKKEMKQKQQAAEDEEEDPLDAFMAGIQDQVSKQTTKPPKKEKTGRGIRDDLEELDDDELYYKYMKENPDAGKLFTEGGEEGVIYDEDGNITSQPETEINRKTIDPLPIVYHSEMDYPEFKKEFYTEHESISQLSFPHVQDLREKLNISVHGISPPKPVSSFAHFGFDSKLISAIRKQEFTTPTPIQAQGIPCVLSGRDVIGIARTGSGKTAAFLWPLLVHVMAQPRLQKGDGPIGVILAPTRELCQQIHQECRKYGKIFNLKIGCCFGGGNMYDQQKQLTG